MPLPETGGAAGGEVLVDESAVGANPGGKVVVFKEEGGGKGGRGRRGAGRLGPASAGA